ncbi:MAG TPA: YihY/virulence factor BrkB family protein [Bryobacteraceae bacterium]|nr:YihY/virulence factor BrkB family protein [Bryobacteraceae bacterium]
MSEGQKTDVPGPAGKPREERLVYALRLLRRIKWVHIKTLLVASFDGWNKQNATRLASSLAFYSLLSIAPLLLVLISIVGMVLGHSTAQQKVTQQVTALVGHAAGSAMAAFVNGSRNTAHGVVATIFGLVTLLFSASGVAIELRSALNVIWHVPEPPTSGFAMVKTFIKERLFSFGMVLGVGFLLIVSLVISTWITAFASLTPSLFPGEAFLFHIVNICFSFLVITFLFSAVYKVVPDVRLEWQDVLLGGAVTSLLFTIGKFLLGVYLGRASYASMYGAAASVVVLIAWVYYSAQIFFFGAEFTREFACRHGSQKKAAAKSPLPSAAGARA